MIQRIAAAAALYFGLVFALGFVLGVARTLALAALPDISRLQAVMIEAPIMLVASWYASAFVVRRFSIPPSAAARAGMGAGAFVLLVLAELLLDVLLVGSTPKRHFQAYGEPSRALGLLAQLCFGLMPLLQSRWR